MSPILFLMPAYSFVMLNFYPGLRAIGDR